MLVAWIEGLYNIRRGEMIFSILSCLNLFECTSTFLPPARKPIFVLFLPKLLIQLDSWCSNHNLHCRRPLVWVEKLELTRLQHEYSFVRNFFPFMVSLMPMRRTEFELQDCRLHSTDYMSTYWHMWTSRGANKPGFRTYFSGSRATLCCLWILI